MNRTIEAKAVHVGDIRMASGTLTIEEAAKVKGNIFIEEGDLFIGNRVTIIGEINLKNGNVRIDGTTTVRGNIFIDEGNLYMEEPVCEGGGAISIKKGNIFIKGVKMTGETKIKGKVIKDTLIKEKPRLGVLRSATH